MALKGMLPMSAQTSQWPVVGVRHCAPGTRQYYAKAEQRQSESDKPAGSLRVKLETLAVQLAAMQGTLNPPINVPWITVFAADPW